MRGFIVVWKGDRSCCSGLDEAELMWPGDMLWGESSGEEEGCSMGECMPTTGATAPAAAAVV